MADVKIVEKHSFVIRATHWLNFVLLGLMIWSGILIYWANDIYVPIPDTAARTFKINNRLAEGMAWHFNIMWIFTINGLIYVSYLLFSGKWRDIVPDRGSWKEALDVTLHDLGIRKQKPAKRGILNGAQRIAYTGILICGAGIVLTGIAIYKPVQVGWLTAALGGYEAARLEHFILMILFVLFLLVHVLQVIRAGWNNFRSMVAGYEIDRD
ncbi:MAG TPA: cytochrome b/b6 domain-containing protein [Bdellovibrionales bacterium]|nr:cytochrome b/b6 domain-containing protein [Bdellovibrionales bacterium]